MIDYLRGLFTPEINNEQLKEDFDENGYIVLKRFFKKPQLKAFEQELWNILINRQELAGDITIDILEGPRTGERIRLKDAPDEAIYGAHKVNDLYLESQACRDLNLNPQLREILEMLFDGQPMVINSLCFRKGSRQPHHFDSYYMPPPVEDKMVVTSICLEKQKITAGPVSYYPGSHKIPAYRFSHGGINAVKEEMDQATDYVMKEIESRGLKRETFLGKPGDVMIWHGQLYHGGLPIEDFSKTRKTLVTHYWRAEDVAPEKVGTTDDGGNYFIKKHQKVG